MEEKNIIQYWVEYIDDYNNRHFTPIQEKTDLEYMQDNYDIIKIETVGA